MKNTLSLFLFALVFVACGNDSSTSANNSDEGEISSKSSSSNRHSGLDPESSSSQKTVSSSSGKVAELVDPADVIVGSMTDSRDGQTYKTVKIGEQVWMAQNLNYETANSYCYNDDVSNCAKYGRLYTWATAVGKLEDVCGYGHSCSLPSGDIQGVCPSGWHLPSKAEWETLFTAVGGSSFAGTKLKSSSGWYNSGNGTDDFSFSALPAGLRYGDGDYDYEGYNAYFWSSTEHGSRNAYDMFLNYYYDNAYLYYNYYKYDGFSVRCLQD